MPGDCWCMGPSGAWGHVRVISPQSAAAASSRGEAQRRVRLRRPAAAAASGALLLALLSGAPPPAWGVVDAWGCLAPCNNEVSRFRRWPAQTCRACMGTSWVDAGGARDVRAHNTAPSCLPAPTQACPTPQALPPCRSSFPAPAPGASRGGALGSLGTCAPPPRSPQRAPFCASATPPCRRGVGGGSS